MSYLDISQRLRIPSAHRNPRNDQLGPRLAAQVTSSAATSMSASPEIRRLQKLLLNWDQVSFLTKSPSADIQACHILNPVRGDRAKNLIVERRLSELRIVGREHFYLDEAYNAILLEASMHVHWAKYANIVFTPALDSLTNMLAALVRSNEEWQRLLDQTGLERRPLDVLKAPFTNILWDALILSADHLLPLNQPLPILSNFELLTPSTSRTELPVWKLHHAVNDTLVASSPSRDPLPPFQHQTTRPIPFQVSPLTMALNASQKIAEYSILNNPVSARLSQYRMLLEQIVDAIWFTPVPTPGSFGALLSATALENSIDKEGPRRSSRLEHTGSSKGSESGTGESNLGRHKRHGSEHDSAPREDEDELGFDGLTNKEWEMLNQVLDDPTTDNRTRAEAGQMLLFGVDGHIRDRTIEPA